MKVSGQVLVVSGWLQKACFVRVTSGCSRQAWIEGSRAGVLVAG